MVAARPLDLSTDFPVKIAPDITLAVLDAGRHPLQAGQPQAEPDRSVWRILSHTLVTAEKVSDEQLHAALPAFPIEALVEARTRVLAFLFVCPGGPKTLAELAACDISELLAEPSITIDEAITTGLLGMSREEWERGQAEYERDRACASST